MTKILVCKVCESSNVQVFHVPQGDCGVKIFILCKECNSANDGKLIEIEEKKSWEVKNEAR